MEVLQSTVHAHHVIFLIGDGLDYYLFVLY
jgi:hypothetical protein